MEDSELIDTQKVLEAVGNTKLGVAQIRLQKDNFIRTVIEKRVEEMIINPIKDSMRNHNFSPKIVDSVVIDGYIIEGNKLRVRIKSEFEVGGFDVAVAREFGTKDHWIRPRLKKALHWITDTGQDAFSKGHVVSGLPNLRLIHNTIKLNKKTLRDTIKQDMINWKNSILRIKP